MEFNGTFLAVIVSFLVFVYLMNKVLYEPIRKIVKERQELVSGNYASAETSNTKAEEIVNTIDKSLVDAKNDARKQYNEMIGNFKNEKNKIVQNAQVEAKDELEEAYKNINNVSNDAKETLKGSMNELANDIAEKILGYRSEIQGFDNDKINDILYNTKG